jgi:hypothetical protein
MRIKTALAYLHVASHDGVSVKEVAEHVGTTSEGSIRYAMKTLGLGRNDQPGYGLIPDVAASTGRTRLYVPTSQGRSSLNAIRRALAQTRTGPELRLVA